MQTQIALYPEKNTENVIDFIIKYHKIQETIYIVVVNVIPKLYYPGPSWQEFRSSTIHGGIGFSPVLNSNSMVRSV